MITVNSQKLNWYGEGMKILMIKETINLVAYSLVPLQGGQWQTIIDTISILYGDTAQSSNFFKHVPS